MPILTNALSEPRLRLCIALIQYWIAKRLTLTSHFPNHRPREHLLNSTTKHEIECIVDELHKSIAPVLIVFNPTPADQHRDHGNKRRLSSVKEDQLDPLETESILHPSSWEETRRYDKPGKWPILHLRLQPWQSHLFSTTLPACCQLVHRSGRAP